MGKRTRRPDEHRHLRWVTELGCLVCLNVDGAHTPAEPHHIRAGQGGSQRASDYLTVPLCPEHHRTGGHGVALHAGQETFEALHGTEHQLLAQTLHCIQAGRPIRYGLPHQDGPEQSGRPTTRNHTEQ